MFHYTAAFILLHMKPHHKAYVTQSLCCTSIKCSCDTYNKSLNQSVFSLLLQNLLQDLQPRATKAFANKSCVTSALRRPVSWLADTVTDYRVPLITDRHIRCLRKKVMSIFRDCWVCPDLESSVWGRLCLFHLDKNNFLWQSIWLLLNLIYN